MRLLLVVALRRMNADAELHGKGFPEIAAAFLAQGTTTTSPAPASPPIGFWAKLFAPDFLRLTVEHVALVFVSLAFSVALGVPRGILAARHPATERALLGGAGVIWTIPALALLAFLIPLTGRIGWVPALIALALYALLPIVRNTHAGLTQQAGFGYAERQIVPQGLRAGI
jgi:osmoprotectant transport system permease protein